MKFTVLALLGLTATRGQSLFDYYNFEDEMMELMGDELVEMRESRNFDLSSRRSY